MCVKESRIVFYSYKSSFPFSNTYCITNVNKSFFFTASAGCHCDKMQISQCLSWLCLFFVVLMLQGEFNLEVSLTWLDHTPSQTNHHAKLSSLRQRPNFPSAHQLNFYPPPPHLQPQTLSSFGLVHHACPGPVGEHYYNPFLSLCIQAHVDSRHCVFCWDLSAKELIH